MKFLSPEVALHPYKSTIKPCMEDYCYVCIGAPSCYLEMLDEWLKWINRTVGPAQVLSIGITLEYVHLDWLNWFHFLILVEG